MSEYMPMVIVAARVLNQRVADTCGIDAEDQWKLYGDDLLNDAQAMLEAAAAPELLEALKALCARLPCKTKSPNAYDCYHARDELDAARAAIAKTMGEA